MKIDWNEAPEWADKHGFVSYEGNPVWLNDEQYCYVDGSQGGKIFRFYPHEGWTFSEIHNISSRPACQPWTGEGKPPVGVPIEMKHKAATSEWARPDFHVETLAWVGEKRFVTSEEKVGDLSDYLFRPIRTPEQIAAEERLASAYAMCGIAPSLCNGDAVALYDAGYRKQVAL